MAVDMQFQTLQIARRATPAGQKMFFVQADARQLPLRNQGADLVFCNLALHHFAEKDALKRVARARGMAKSEAYRELQRNRSK